MRILTKYILREVISYALIGVGVFTFVFFMVNLEKILELVVRNSAPLPSVIAIFAYTLPKTLTLTFPMGVLVGILIGLSRLAADSEITAMRSIGMGSWTFVRATSIFVLVACGLAIVNNVVVAPRAAAALSRLQDRLKSSQASFEVQPRVFYEEFPNHVLYVQDTGSGRGAATWKGVFLADVGDASTPKLTMAHEAVVMGDTPDSLHLHLIQGEQHEADLKQTERYSITTFGETDLVLPMPAVVSDSAGNTPAAELPTAKLLAQAKREDGNRADALGCWIEFHRRWAMAIACLVLAMVGIPLGLSAKKGGKSTGFVLTIVLVFVYYIVALVGMSLARQEKVPVPLGMWLSDGLFLIAWMSMLFQVNRFAIRIPSWREGWSRLRQALRENKRHLPRVSVRDSALGRMVHRSQVKYGRFPMILDDLIMEDFFVHLGLILCTFLVLMMVFTFFELLRDIVRNHVPMTLVGEYLINLIPFLLYNLLPLSVLLAVLTTFGLMQKSNEITAMKATGISIYRMAMPILFIALLMAAGLFFFDQYYLPQANKRQDALRNQIKGKAAQTYLRPERKWIFGQRSTIYYYEFFDSDQGRFGSIQAFEFDPHTFEVTRRIYGTHAHWSEALGRWVFEQGWERSFRGSAIEDYHTFDVATYPELNEPPGYFKKEVKQSSEMSCRELRRYIEELQQSGFDVVRLRVQMQKKFAYPLITFVMAVLAIPFALRTGRHGALAGVASAFGIGVVYWVSSGLFEAMGNTSQLPPVLAAWCRRFTSTPVQ